MNRYAFVLGKNPALSAAEIAAVLKSREIPFSVQDSGREFIVIVTPEDPGIDCLGGTIKIGRVFSTWHGQALEDAQLSVALERLGGATEFGLSAYGAPWKKAAMAIKKKSEARGRGAKFFNIPPGRDSLTHVEVIKQRLVEDSAEFLLLSGRQSHLATTEWVHNPFEFQKRDMSRPFKRPMLSIPPRLARIMINLSGARQGTVLDPFCGIGTVLQEAALMGFGIFGIDTDKRVIPWAVRNLKWLDKEYLLKMKPPDDVIRLGDARKLPELFPRNIIDAIVTEPDLGPPLKVQPDRNRGLRIIRSLSPLYERFIRGASEIIKPSGSIVTVSPMFDTGGQPLRLNIEAIASRNGLSVSDPFQGTGLKHGIPLVDRDEGQRTIREISILRPE